MTTDDREIVSALRAKLSERLGDHRYELWFGSGSRFRLERQCLVVDVANAFYQGWLRTHFRQDLEAVCQETVGQKLAVTFRVDATLARKTARARTATPAGTAAAPAGSRSGAAAPGGARPATGCGGLGSAGTRVLPVRKYAELSRFVVGAGNKLAHTSAQMAIERPGSVSPLLLYGATGCGKTHLLESIFSAARRTHQGIRAVYLTAERFTSCFLEALNGRGLPSFRQRYRGLDLLVIDDVQFFVGKKATLRELLYTADTLITARRQLVFASDRPPAELAAFGPDLITRLSGGLICRIEAADFGTRQGVVRQICERLEVPVPEDVQTLVAAQGTADARQLAGTCHRLQLCSLAHRQPVTRALAERVLAEHRSQLHRSVRLPDIQRVVCELFGLDPHSLQSKCNSSAVNHPRTLAMWLARKHTRAALSEIGSYFGRKSHSSVISAQKKVQRWMDQHECLTLGERTCKVEEAIRRVEELLRIA